MDNSPDDSGSARASKNVADNQFRAIVKRLLDTPPMHKTAGVVKQTRSRTRQRTERKTIV
jgi:hypothetical protein